MKIFKKLFLSHITLGLLVIVALSSIFYILLSSVLIERTLNQLASINILKKELVENHFFRSRQNLEALQLEHKFLHIYKALLNQPKLNTRTNTDLLEIDDIGKLYNFSSIHIVKNDHEQLFSTDGEVYPERLLHNIDSLVHPHPDRIQIIDASAYTHDKSPTLFYYVPILNNNQRVGIVLVQENFQKIQSILLETPGMGSTGESYLVSKDYTMRSASRFLPDTPPVTIKVETQAVKNSFQGAAGYTTGQDYRGIQVLSAYSPITNEDLQWAIISEIDWSEAMKPINQLRSYLIAITLLIIVITAGITYFISNIIANPILQLNKIIVALSKGIIPESKPPVAARDEISEMAHAIYTLTESMHQTTSFAKAIGTGNFNVPFQTLSEYDTLGLALIRMRDELHRYSEREIKLARSRAAALLEGQEKERSRITKELHDGVGQLLTAIRMRIDMLENGNGAKEEIKSQIDETINEVKRISYNVMPQAIVDYGLDAALKGLLDTIKKYSSFTIDFTYIKEQKHSLNFEISIALFRIAQEGLNNILKHASATQVTLHVIDKEDEVYFLLEDNGKGFSEKAMAPATGFGLRNIRERVTLLNGSVEIHAIPTQGTVIEIHIPK